MAQVTTKLNHSIQIVRDESNREFVAMKNMFESFAKEVNGELTQVAVILK
jgi:hypothetical protein